jgi:hypothetical protein
MLMLPIQVAARNAVSPSGIAEYLVVPHAEARLASALPVEAIGSLIDAVDDGHTARLKKARKLQAAELAELRSLQAELAALAEQAGINDHAGLDHDRS